MEHEVRCQLRSHSEGAEEEVTCAGMGGDGGAGERCSVLPSRNIIALWR